MGSFLGGRLRTEQLVLLLAVLAVAAGTLLATVGGHPWGWFLAGGVSTGLLVLAVVSLGRRAMETRTTQPLPWALLAAGLSVDVAAGGWALWSLAAGHFAVAEPGSAVEPLHELRHLVQAPLIVAGLLLLPHGRQSRRRTWETLVDTAAAGCSFVVITRQFLLPEDLASVVPWEVRDGFFDMAWIVGLGTVLVYVVSRTRTPGGLPMRSLVPLCVGLGLAAVSETLTVLAAAAPAEVVAASSLSLAAIAWVLVAVGARNRGLAPEGHGALGPREYTAVLVPLVAPAVAAVVVSVALVRGSWLAAGSVVAAVLTLFFLLVSAAATRVDALLVTRTLESRVLERTLALGTREKWFRALVQNSSDVVTVMTAMGVVRYVTPSVTSILGHDPEALAGTSFMDLLPPTDARRLERRLAEALADPHSTLVVGFPILHSDGHWVETETYVTSLIDDPDIRGLVLTTRDVSERRRLEQQLTNQAYSDSLTGLANRAMFRQRVESALEEAATEPHGSGVGSVAVVFLDLDGFKAVNDTEGHATGDILLGHVASRIGRCVRPQDVVARLGGDEFGVLVVGEGAESGAVWIAQRVRSALLSEFVIDGRPIRVGMSAGIAVNDAGHETADNLLRNADLAMYRAKSSRVASFVRFETQMHEALLTRVRAEADLREAVERGDLTMHYQPIIDLSRDVVVGAEALVRWPHSTRGLVSPAVFIDLAEETGLIHDIGTWALVEAARQGVAWQGFAPQGEEFNVAVNVSAKQLNPGLPSLVRNALALSGLNASALTLEMTESVLISYDEEASKLMRRLKQLGVRVAIDDFGTGYSSLSYLTRFPVDVLKIDQSFIDQVGADNAQAELARTIVQLGQSLRLVTVAEGIETADQWHRLRAMGCRLGQGYLFARPMAPRDVERLMERSRVLGSASRAGAELSPTVEPVTH